MASVGHDKQAQVSLEAGELKPRVKCLEININVSFFRKIYVYFNTH